MALVRIGEWSCSVSERPWRRDSELSFRGVSRVGCPTFGRVVFQMN